MLNISLFLKNRLVGDIGLAFAASGSIFGTWAAMIPHLKSKFSLDEAELGLLLLAPPLGIVLANPLSVPVLGRFGPGRSTVAMVTLTAAAAILPIQAPNITLVAVSLLFFGACMSVLNVAMNTTAAQLEQRDGLRMLSTCHGLWSAGAMTGSALAGAVTGLGVPHGAFVIGAAAFFGGLSLYLRNTLPEIGKIPQNPDNKRAKSFVFPSKALWLLIVISLCTNLTEGTMSDWAAVYMREVLGSGETLAAWGFSVYAFFMATGRFFGDGLIIRFGPSAALRIGGAVALLGLVPAVFLQNQIAVLCGFAAVGAGVSLGAPILYASAARVPGMAPGAGLATMNTFAMLGFLGGPAMIGFIAQAASLPIAFGVVGGVVGVWILLSGRVFPKTTNS